MKSKILIWRAGGRRAPAGNRRTGNAPQRKGGAMSVRTHRTPADTGPQRKGDRFVGAFISKVAKRSKVKTPLASLL